MLEIRLIPRKEFQRIQQAGIDNYDKLALLADMCRANALATVKKAGSGHLGSSFSSLDIVTLLYYSVMNTVELGLDHPDRDIYFSSKGHDVPGHYAVLYALGILPEEQFIKLRRLGGTHGHPDVSVPGIEANSGSLGMGISKAKGMALAKHYQGAGGRVFVMTGDGELQEGQIWESLQTAVHQKVSNINVIIDFNKIQTDKPVEEIVELGDLEKKFATFGWHVERCSGHDFAALQAAFAALQQIGDRPKVLIADTIKGKGVSFMEGPTALREGKGLYSWHAGAPDDEAFEAGYQEMLQRLQERLQRLGLAPLATRVIERREKHRTRLKDTAEKVVNAYGEALVELGGRRKDLVVLDADLSADCGLRAFETTFPERFIENGIAEQDMVSTAGGLALQGLLPIVNSFGVFLASRANEQIYNNATEHTKIIYVCHYAGLIPAGPGKSHQSLRDVSLFGALPNCTIIEPCNAVETKQALEWCVMEAAENCMLRLVISPSPRTIALPENYRFFYGRGTVLRDGSDAVLFGYGPVLLHEALVASEILAEQGIHLKVIDMPWLNRLDRDWFQEVTWGCSKVFVLDNHAPYGGLGDCLLKGAAAAGLLLDKHLVNFAVDDFPACGTPPEVLQHHGLDGASLSRRIAGILQNASK
ncbi:MAG: 1-deoxy-D-xylulose-5-phosphate synthase [Deltaproteobacteria bacterium]|nr:1-deoxy-D-xylulose-5-phosphate synthase [Deltaproteobacteria bacterium]